MVRQLVLGIYLSFGSLAFCQDVALGERAGLLEVSGSIYPTVSLNQHALSNFVGGHLAFQFDEKYSFRGDILTFTSLQSGSPLFNDYFLVEAGFLRNFTSKRFDYFVGIELGLSHIQIQHPVEEFGITSLSYGTLNRSYYQPVFDLTTGFKFHVSNYFYFYAEAKLLNNRHPEKVQMQSNLAFTGGLGLQLPCKKLQKGYKMI